MAKRLPERPTLFVLTLSIGSVLYFFLHESVLTTNHLQHTRTHATHQIMSTSLTNIDHYKSAEAIDGEEYHPKLFIRQSDPLPPQINGSIRLVFISDTHGRHDEITLPEGDVLFHLGDACHKGNMDEMRSFVEWLKKNSGHKERIVIDGNHDRDIVTSEEQTKRDFMAEYTGVARVLKNEVVEVAGGRLSVLGITWDATASEDLSEATRNIQAWSDSYSEGKQKKVDLVLSHLPPYVQGGGSAWRYGSGVLSHFVKDTIKPHCLHCNGHFHYARGVAHDHDNNITMLNCASFQKTIDVPMPVVVDYCPTKKRPLMIHIPILDQKMLLKSRKFPRQWLEEKDRQPPTLK